jgi:hypothetical protein
MMMLWRRKKAIVRRRRCWKLFSQAPDSVKEFAVSLPVQP